MSGSRRRLVLLALLLLVAIAAPVAVWMSARPTQSAFTDVEAFGENHLGAGRLDLEVGNASIVLETDTAAPGDRLDGTIVLNNVGNLPLRYRVVATAHGADLAPWVTWWLGESAGGSCETATPLSPPTSIDDGATVELIGAQGNQPTIAAAGSQSLCLVADVAIESPNSVQSTGIELVIDIFAEHDFEPEV